ncbi:MAG: TCP-1/cpn60 chaperonin family protein [Natronomonas sp.]|uniref:TCP-1/cpn60 chaperonin family protein n=1 Tax=Natronomonas sp. TaxID=2184060 RepID=UPI0028701572|nr:TCP-1/cpn60 chaperonin family protein [Natronomonas sp.]MDR9430823.1 TCP-1/cpn60 chaperonin family protein [Natronomonas sp.]
MTPSSISSSDAATDQPVLDGVAQLGELAAGLYGPDGRDKLVVTERETVVTGDLHQLFDTLDLRDPGARIAANAAVQQKEAAGDGSVAVVLLIGSLATQADELLERGLHRATIADGYHRGQRRAVAALADLETPAGGLNGSRGRAAIRSALGRANDVAGSVATVIEAARLVHHARARRDGGIGIERIDFHHRAGATAPRVELRRGLVLEREAVTPNTPGRIDDARIAIIGGGKKAGRGIEERELKRTGGSTGKGRTDVAAQTATPDDLDAFRQHEAGDVAAQVQRLVQANVDVVFTTMGISDRAIAALDSAGITAFRALQAGHARRVSRATGAKVVMQSTEFEPEDVGKAGLVEAESDEDPVVWIEECPESGVGTLLVTGALQTDASSLQRELMTGIAIARSILDGNHLVPGGGGAWIELAAAVRDAATKVADRCAVAMEAYADALETLPRTLVRNSGANPIDVLAQLRASEGAVFDGKWNEVRAADEHGPYDLAPVVESSVRAASDVAIQFVRIDEMLPAAAEPEPEVDKESLQPNPERDVA